MQNTLVQFRTSEASKNQASSICEKLGIDLPTYYRICTAKLIEENGIPFDMRLKKNPEMRGIRALRSAGAKAQEDGLSDMTLDEINAEIQAVRNKQ